MEIDLNEVAKTFKPWDFTIVVDGVRHKTKPFRLAEAEVISQLQGKSEAEQKAFVAGLFADPAPDVSGWDEERCSYVLAALQAARWRMIRKNGRAVASAVTTGPMLHVASD